MKISRRQLALALAGGAAAGAAAVVPLPAQNSQAAAPDWDKAAREALMQSTRALLKVEVPMDIEPAFHFKA
jgi:16S rRNA U1498 N3-methylase RsmE